MKQGEKTEYPIMPMTTAQRDAIVNPKIGYCIYNTDTERKEFFNGVWKPIKT